MVIDGFTDHFTHSTANTGFLHHGKTQGRNVHGKGIRRTLRDTGMAALACRAESMRNCRHSHSDMVDPLDRKERVCLTRCNARKILTYQAGRLISEKHGCPVPGMGRDRAWWTGRDTIIALRTTFKEKRFFYCTRRAQPVHTDRQRQRLRWNTLSLFDEFARGFDGRNNGVFQEIPPTV